MPSIASKPAGPDRPRRALALLADAGETGLTTPELMRAAGEIGTRPLRWFGSIMRDAERRGWAERTGVLSTGAWQQGRAVQWRITEAGRERLADYDRARSVPTTRQVAAERREAVAEAESHRALAIALAQAIIDDRPDLTDDQRLRIVRDLRAEGCLLREIGTLFGVSREYIRLALKFDSWPVTTAMMIRTEE
jgi:hypothetical protein